ncbi:MAG: metallophosphoesterase [Pseudomonadota bacterium]
MFKLAHISDVHLGPLPEPTWRQLANKRILGYVNWKRNRKQVLTSNYLEGLLSDLPEKNPDHIMVSGDLVNLSLPEEFCNAADFLKLLGDPQDVSAVCGNHDAYVRGGFESAIEKWQPYIAGDEQVTAGRQDFPYLRIRGDVAIIGCNSAEATAPFMATGFFRRDQAERLAAILTRTVGLCRVVAIHHPPIAGSTSFYKRLVGDDLFRSVVSQHGAELIIHGHTHLATTNFIPGVGGNVPVIGVPAAGNAEGGKKPAGRYNLFTLNKEKHEWHINHEAYGYSATDKKVICLEQSGYCVVQPVSS